MTVDKDNKGTIVKSSAGFYTVETSGGGLVQCRARGIFRKENIKPCVGDAVAISVSEDGSGVVDEIFERKNNLIRPPLSNLDAMVVALSVRDPAPNLFVADTFIAILEYKGIEPIIAVTKSDLDAGAAAEIAKIYGNAGFTALCVSCESGEGIDALKSELAGKFSAFSGNSGVGKSSLLNAIDKRLGLEVGETSKKLGRGRHTTRTTEIFTIAGGGRVADTPGFSSIELTLMSEIDKDELPLCFREFESRVKDCRFDDCAHTARAGCAVLEAVENGEIAGSRHNSYIQLFDQIKDIKQWERR